MAKIEEACNRLKRWTVALTGELDATLEHVRSTAETGPGGVAEAEMEFEGILRKLDEINDAAGECLDAIREQADVVVAS